MQLTSFILAFAASVTAFTPPGLTPQSSNDLIVAFGNVLAVNGQNVPRNSTLNAPSLGTAAPLTGSYTLMMVDYDIPGGTRLLHWMQHGFASAATTSTLAGKTVHALVSNEAAYATYNPPNPPNRAPTTHRYVQMLLNTTAANNASAVLADVAKTRTNFDPAAVVTRAGVTVVAGNWFNVTNANATAVGTATSTAGGPAKVTSIGGAQVLEGPVSGLVGAMAFAAVLL